MLSIAKIINQCHWCDVKNNAKELLPLNAIDHKKHLFHMTEKIYPYL